MNNKELEHQVEMYLYYLHRQALSCKTQDAQEDSTLNRQRAKLELEAFLKWLKREDTNEHSH